MVGGKSVLGLSNTHGHRSVHPCIQIRCHNNYALYFAKVKKISNIFINLAFTMQIVPYVISIKRMAILVSVIFGGVFFHEKNMIRRISAASLMVLGSALIIIF